MKTVAGMAIIVVVIVSLTYFIVPFSDARYLNTKIRRLEPDLLGYKSAIYLIKEATVCCRPCPELDLLKKEGTKILFLFQPDFSENDIHNFRLAFNVPDGTDTRIMNPQWQTILERLEEKNRNSNFNFLITLTKKSAVDRVWRF